jgi:hypothetical protein
LLSKGGHAIIPLMDNVHLPLSRAGVGGILINNWMDMDGHVILYG